MLGWQAYNASLAPISRDARSVASREGRPCVNFLGGDLQLPPALDAPCYDGCERGPMANRAPAVHDGFGGADFLREIERQV